MVHLCIRASVASNVYLFVESHENTHVGRLVWFPKAHGHDVEGGSEHLLMPAEVVIRGYRGLMWSRVELGWFVDYYFGFGTKGAFQGFQNLAR